MQPPYGVGRFVAQPHRIALELESAPLGPAQRLAREQRFALLLEQRGEALRCDVIVPRDDQQFLVRGGRSADPQRVERTGQLLLPCVFDRDAMATAVAEQAHDALGAVPYDQH